MTINAKSGGAIKDIVVSFKRNAVYGAMQGVYAKAGGVYGRVDAAAYPPKDFYFTDFAGVANNTQLRNLPGWASTNQLGAPQTAVQWAVQSEVLRYGTTGEAGTAPGNFIIYRDMGSTDHVIRFPVTVMLDAGRELYTVAAATSNQNAILLVVVSNGTKFNQYRIDKNVGGTVSNLVNGSLGASVGLSGQSYELRIIGQNAWFFIDGAQIATCSLDTGGAYTKGQFAGFGTRSSHNAGVDNLYMAQLATNLQVTTTQAFWPGSIEGGGRSVPFSGTYQGTLLALQYRVLNASTLAEVQTWAAMTGASISGGAWSASGFVPMSSISTNPEYVVEVRAANDTDAVARSTVFAVGIAISQYGQSNANNRDGFGAFATATSYSLINTSYVVKPRTGGWVRYSGATTSPAAQMSSILAGFTGVPVGHVVIGWGGQTIDALTGESDPANSGDALYFDDLREALALYGVSGYVYAWNWTQGEEEANTSGSANEAAYRATFLSLVDKLHSLAGRETPIGVSIIGKSTTPNAASTWGAMRAVSFRLADIDGVVVSHNFVDTPMADDFHYTANGYLEANRRTALSLAKAMGYSTHDGRGPIITGATRSGATITLAVDLNGASSISGTGLNYYEVSTDDFATTKTISSAAVSGGNIVITLSADPGAAVKVRSFYSNSYGNSPNQAPVFAIGTYADATTIPVEPLFVPITSN